VAGLNDAGLECAPPAGAFYAFPNAERVHKDSRVAAGILLEKAHLASIPGSVFGAQGEGHIRLSYAVTVPEIEAAVAALKGFMG
jgi:aspartate aminotransferase